MITEDTCRYGVKEFTAGSHLALTIASLFVGHSGRAWTFGRNQVWSEHDAFWSWTTSRPLLTEVEFASIVGST